MTFRHRIVFTRNAFDPANRVVADLLAGSGGRRVLALVEDSVAAAWPELSNRITDYFEPLETRLCGVLVHPGGEAVKADNSLVRQLWQAIERHHIDRHSFVLAIGGGAFLDVAGFAAATAHRGVRLLRFPTTTLAQADSGVGVKCGINGFGKKNWVGSFAVPYAVVNDGGFLATQPPDAARAGLVEAVKVALVKDDAFFEWIERNVAVLAALEPGALATCIERSALLHARHIATGGDPFETGSSRPLDYGHWAAHKLESLTSHRLSHAGAVSVGLALDTLYACRSGLLDTSIRDRLLAVLGALRLPVYHPALDWTGPDGERLVLAGIEEFREHLGGTLTVLMLRGIGQSENIHRLDRAVVGSCIGELHRLANGPSPG